MDIITVVTLVGTYSSAWVHTGDYIKQALIKTGEFHRRLWKNLTYW